ncbi:MAG TPA: alpha/beta fold hydrolase [Bacilli bacterium]|nr:alpha/beta fold hydrolase [Bacilli bacterium]
MQQAVTLEVRGLTMRGMAHVPEATIAGREKVPTVILYHGFGGNMLGKHRMFLKLCRELERIGFASYRFDFIGSGESDGNFEEMTVSHEIEEAHAIFDYVKSRPHVDSERIIVLGISMGGLVAGIVAAERPQEVDKLVLLCPAGDVQTVFKPYALPYLQHPHLQVVDMEGDLVGRAFAEEVVEMDVFGRSKGYAGPVLLVHGTADPLVPFQTSELYKQHCYGDQATIHPITGADHTFNKHEWEREMIEVVTGFVG